MYSKISLIAIILCLLHINVLPQQIVVYDYNNCNQLSSSIQSSNTQITYTYDELGNRLTKVVTGGGYQISGQVSYAKQTGAVVLPNMQLKLKNSNGDIIQTTTSNASGNYTFTGVPNGTYTIVPGNTIPWSNLAVNSYDPYLYQLDIVGTSPLSVFRRRSGDVDNSGNTNSYDCYLIQCRIVGISTSFLSGDWLLEDQQVTINGSNLVKNLSALMFGDADGSYNP